MLFFWTRWPIKKSKEELKHCHNKLQADERKMAPELF